MRQEGQQGVRRGDVVTTADEGRMGKHLPSLASAQSRKDRDAADTHVQCQRALLCTRAARATQVHVRHWECVHASVWSQQSCGSRLLWSYSFLWTGTARAHALRPGAAFRLGRALP